MADEPFDALLRRLEQAPAPDVAFADRLFDHLIDEAGLGGRRPGRLGRIRRWFAIAPATTRQLAWLAVLAALLIALLGLLITPRGGQPPPLSVSQPSSRVSPSPQPSLHLGSSRLSVGGTAPKWTGTQLDGGTFSSADLPGQPTALLLWCSCHRGPELRWFVEAARARHDVRFVIVSMDSDGTTRGLADDLAIDIPVVLDSSGRLVDAWGLEGFPAILFFRADATVADIQTISFGQEKLTALIDALANNTTIPEPDTRAPVPTDALGRQRLSTVLEVGAVAPELIGPKLGGGTISTRTTPGKTTLVQFWLPPRADGTPQDDTPQPDALIDEVAHRRGAVRLLLVVETEVEEGDAQRYLDARGTDVDVLVDHTGELFARWGLVQFQTSVLLDAKGRVVRVVGPEALRTPTLVLDGPADGDVPASDNP